MADVENAESGDILASRSQGRRRLTRRQRRAYAGLAVVAALAAAVATPIVLTDGVSRRTPVPPVATATSSPSPDPSLSSPPPLDEFLGELPVGERTDVPFAVGARIFAGDEQVTLPTQEPILAVAPVQGGYLVLAGERPPFSVGIVGEQPYRELAEGSTGSIAAAPDGRAAAWTTLDPNDRLTEIRTRSITSGRTRATRELGQWHVHGWIGDEVLIFPGPGRGGPKLWSPAAGSTRRLPMPPNQRGWVHPVGFQASGDVVLTREASSNCITAYRVSDVMTRWDRCARGGVGAVSEAGRIVLTKGLPSGLHLTVRDITGALIREIDMGAPALASAVVWESAESLVLHVRDISEAARVSPVERTALVRCGVSTGRCERVPTPPGSVVTALAESWTPQRAPTR